MTPSFGGFMFIAISLKLFGTALASIASTLFAAFFETRSISIFFPRGFWGWIIIGLLAGWLAGQISRGRGYGCIADIVLGVIGSYIGGWIFLRLGIGGFGFWWSLAAATVGAVVLVGIAHILTGGGDRN
jgi:uncharacterized membrane protein YeaQ/YmgE (transglycosylase-associated protein family)